MDTSELGIIVQWL